ncbi:hypothetical protein OV079_52470 [Nannocystis pusilla]|uniref:Uncharacterized protein n=1 Tax=Nannocystis pusilla TaxID=889268 RepID=A0A9X3F9R4_9BACT|nr:hypothetical protein [Nannocystis pusilla]MCY1014001.1 hypothetical protein [Nannocystis pusilla]
MSSIDIRVAVDPLRPQLRQCHASAIDRGLLATVPITARLSVRGAAVESVAPVTSRSPSSLWRCVRDVLQRATFKTAPQYAEVTVELRLGPPTRHE